MLTAGERAMPTAGENSNANIRQSRCVQPRRNKLKSEFVVQEFENEDAGVQDNGLQILSLDKPGWRRVTHTCNDV